jgi:hypothetical protein
MLSPFLTKTALAALPAAAAPLPAILVPILWHILSKRTIEFHFTLR